MTDEQPKPAPTLADLVAKFEETKVDYDAALKAKSGADDSLFDAATELSKAQRAMVERIVSLQAAAGADTAWGRQRESQKQLEADERKRAQAAREAAERVRVGKDLISDLDEALEGIRGKLREEVDADEAFEPLSGIMFKIERVVTGGSA